MHTALQVLDVISLIVEHLRGDRAELANLAQTCKAFEAPCTASIWASLAGLQPLLALLPPQVSGRWPAVKTSAEQDWRSFKRHASLIRELSGRVCARDADETGLHRNTIDLTLNIFLSLPSGPLLPRLRSLEIGIETDTALDRAHVLLSDSLDVLTCRLGPAISRPNVLQFICLLPTSVPELSLIAVEGDPFDDADVQEHLAETLKRLPKLTIAQFNLRVTADFDLVRSLEGLALERLSVVSEDIPSTWYVRPVGFDQLHYLSIHAPLELCTETMARLTLVSLGHLEVKVHYFSSPELTETLCTHVARLSSTLRILHIFSCTDHSNHHGAAVQVLPSNVAALLECHNLEDVLLQADDLTDSLLWCDADVQRLAESWKSLRSLHIASSPKARNHITLSLNGLSPFAEFCKSLRILTVTLNMTGFQKPDTQITGAPALEELQIDGFSVVDDGTRVFDSINQRLADKTSATPADRISQRQYISTAIIAGVFIGELWPNATIRVLLHANAHDMEFFAQLTLLAYFFNTRKTEPAFAKLQAWALDPSSLVDDGSQVGEGSSTAGQ